MNSAEIIEVSRETYGHDARAINRHSDRTYRDQHGRYFMLSKTLDGIPPFFEAYGPYREDHVGLLPVLKVEGREYWGDGWSRQRAFAAFAQAVPEQRRNRTEREADNA